MVGTNEPAAEIASEIRAELVRLGRVEEPRRRCSMTGTGPGSAT